MPRPTYEIPRNMLPAGVDEDMLIDAINNRLAALGAPFAKKLAIRGTIDIWAHGKVAGRSNKRIVFGAIYMIPKECRTDEVRHEFGEAVKKVIRDTCEEQLGFKPGVDMPIRVVPVSDYIECEEGDTAH